MQSTLILTATHPGILYLNGGFAGEVNADVPLMRPVAGRGAMYMDFRPLDNRCRGMARRLVFSGGEPLAESVEGAENINVVLWPGGAVETELSPELNREGGHRFQLAGHSFELDERMLLCCGGMPISTLPEGADIPEHRPLAGGAALVGRCSDGQYLLTMDTGFTRQTGFLKARQLQIEDDGRIRAINAAGDLVGHATLENWRLTPEGLMLISSENAWAQGAPQWPRTPDETARAAIEAILGGLIGEAEAYLSPALRSRFDFDRIRQGCDLCVEMKYALPDARPGIGLLRLEGDRLARVRPLYYRAVPSGGPQGPWQIEQFEWE